MGPTSNEMDYMGIIKANNNEKKLFIICPPTNVNLMQWYYFRIQKYDPTQSRTSFDLAVSMMGSPSTWQSLAK
jgi:hypothetical protein